MEKEQLNLFDYVSSQGVRVLSVFDGMACGMLAMLESGIKVERYVAYEIDKYAVQTSTHNLPMIEQRGDVFKADFTEFKGFDYLIGGSPCTYWSIAQKNNRETEASGMGWELFSQYVKALHEAKPKYFVYENNKSMSKAIRASIDEAFGFEAVYINSALVSAQNRQRLNWVGRRNEDGTYSKVDIKQPEDRGILLKDILEKHSYTMVSGPIKNPGYGIGYRGRIDNGKWVKQYEANGTEKANALTTAQTDSMVAEPCRVGTYPNNAKNQTHDSQQYRVYSTDAKSVTLCGNGGGLGAKTGLYAIESKSPYATPCEWTKNGKPTKVTSGADGKIYDVYEVKDGYITIKGKNYPIKLADGFYIIRKPTVKECMRLQTVPEWYEFPVSDSQAYKMLGNGWTVSVISWLLNATKEKEK